MLDHLGVTSLQILLLSRCDCTVEAAALGDIPELTETLAGCLLPPRGLS